MQDSNLEDDTARFVLDCRTRLQNILHRLEWSQEGVVKNFNTNSSAATYTQPTQLKQTPATEARDYPPGCLTKNSLVLVTPELQNLLKDDKVEAPRNFHDLQSNFSREQKLQIYEHVIQNTKRLDNNTVDKVPDGEQSLAEIVAENKRAANRKKRKFRIAKPTRIEEVRALVEIQMQSLQQFLRKQKEVGSKKCTSMKEKYPHGIDSTINVQDSKRHFHRGEYSKSYSDRNIKTEEKYKSNRGPTEYYGRFRSDCKSSSNSYRKPETCYNIRKDSPSKHEINGAKSPRCSGSLDRKDKREYDKHKRTRSRSPVSRKYKDKYGKHSETYQKDDFDRHKKKRSRSLEPSKLRSDRSTKSKKVDDKVKKVERDKDRDRHRRSRSRDKHHQKKKYKKSRSRSKSRDNSKRTADKKGNSRYRGK